MNGGIDMMSIGKRSSRRVTPDTLKAIVLDLATSYYHEKGNRRKPQLGEVNGLVDPVTKHVLLKRPDLQDPTVCGAGRIREMVQRVLVKDSQEATSSG